MEFKFKQKLIQKYLKPEALKARGAWGKEMKILNGLVEIYKEETFWLWYKPTFPLNSMAWFIGDGKSEIEKAHQAFMFDKFYKSDKVEDVKTDDKTAIIPPNPVLNKPNTLSSWLKK